MSKLQPFPAPYVQIRAPKNEQIKAMLIITLFLSVLLLFRSMVFIKAIIAYDCLFIIA